MNTLKKIFSILGWIITIVLQIALGQIGGTLAIAIGQGKMQESMILLWVGITAGVFLIGALAILLRHAIHPKKYIFRLGLTCLGALIPITVLLIFGLNQGFDSEIISGGLGLILTLFASILGLIGFYIPGWIKSKQQT